MNTKKPIDRLTIKGFKSIKECNQLRLDRLNILIGANGVGKSNFVSYFEMLSKMIHGELQLWATHQGGADRIVSYGVKETDVIQSFVEFGLNGYLFEIAPTVEGGFSFTGEKLFFKGPFNGPEWISFGAGHKEATLKQQYEILGQGSDADYCYSSIANWKVFHFHDTSDTAGVKRWGSVQDTEYLRADASNLAAYLYWLSENHPLVLEQIRRTVQLAIPQFDNFILKPRELQTQEQQINLQWKQKNSDYTLWPSQLSDGSIRFICLVTALLQPDPPSTIIIDEPELGLHPYAITLLGSLLRSAALRMQVIVSTQSVPLVNEFAIDDLIIVERENGATVFKRYEEDTFKTWLEDYSVGELWEKNILGGRPKK